MRYGEPTSRTDLCTTKLPDGSTINVIHLGWVYASADTLRGHGILVGHRNDTPVFYVSFVGADPSRVVVPAPGVISFGSLPLPVNEPSLINSLTLIGDARVILNEVVEANAVWNEHTWNTITIIDGFVLPKWREWEWQKAECVRTEVLLDGEVPRVSVLIMGSRTGPHGKQSVATVIYRSDTPTTKGSWELTKIEFLGQ
jgi:hypothetical protein